MAGAGLSGTGRYRRDMRRLALVPLLAVGLLPALTGCAQATHVAADALGVPLEEICATADDAYGQYRQTVDQVGVTQEQLGAARDSLVQTLDDLADEVGGQVGELIRTQSAELAGVSDLSAPESMAAVEQAKSALSAVCE